MTAVDERTSAMADDTSARKYPPVSQLGGASLVAVILGGILMASSFPSPPQLAAPIALLIVSAGLFAAGVVLLLRTPWFSWHTFVRVGRWALLAYVISAGLIEFAFVRNHASGAPLVVVSCLLVLFALDVALGIAFTVARYEA